MILVHNRRTAVKRTLDHLLTGAVDEVVTDGTTERAELGTGRMQLRFLGWMFRRKVLARPPLRALQAT